MPRRVDDITNKRMRFEAAVAAMQGLLAGNHQVTPWTTAVEAADALLAELAKTKETEIPGAPDVGALVAKRCHYCDALMRECEIEKDGVFVGVQYRCSAGCP